MAIRRPVRQPMPPPSDEHDEHADERMHPALDQIEADHRDQRQERTHGKIDPCAGDDEGHADSDDHVVGSLGQNIGEVRDRGEARIDQREDQRETDDDDREAKSSEKPAPIGMANGVWQGGRWVGFACCPPFPLSAAGRR